MPTILMLLEKEFPQDDRVEKEALSLMKGGFKIILLSPNFSNKPSQESYKGIKIIRFSIKKSHHNKLLGLSQHLPFFRILWYRKSLEILKERKVDVVHVHDLPLCKVGLMLKRKHKLRYVADMHENYPAMVRSQEHARKFPHKLLISISGWYKREKKWLKQADFIICTAKGMIERLKKILGENKTFVLTPNTLFLTEFDESQKSNPEIEKKFLGKFGILSYGVVSEARGIQFLIEAIPIIKEHIDNLLVLIVGEGKYLTVLKEQAHKLGVASWIAFEGWQPQSYLNSYMRNTEIAIIPHIKSEHTDNTSPNKLFMFMHFGKPVVTSNCRYIEEIIEKEECGVVFENGNVAQLAKYIIDLYRDIDKRKLMGSKAKAAIERKYNWEETIKPLVSTYKKISVNG